MCCVVNNFTRPRVVVQRRDGEWHVLVIVRVRLQVLLFLGDPENPNELSRKFWSAAILVLRTIITGKNGPPGPILPGKNGPILKNLVRVLARWIYRTEQCIGESDSSSFTH